MYTTICLYVDVFAFGLLQRSSIHRPIDIIMLLFFDAQIPHSDYLYFLHLVYSTDWGDANISAWFLTGLPVLAWALLYFTEPIPKLLFFLLLLSMSQFSLSVFLVSLPNATKNSSWCDTHKSRVH